MKTKGTQKVITVFICVINKSKILCKGTNALKVVVSLFDIYIFLLSLPQAFAVSSQANYQQFYGRLPHVITAGYVVVSLGDVHHASPPLFLKKLDDTSSYFSFWYLPRVGSLQLDAVKHILYSSKFHS